MFARTMIAAAGALLLSTPALAQPEAKSTTVSFADIDISSDAGRAQLDRRVRNAAANVCGPTERDMNLRASFDECMTGALAATDRQIAALKQGETRIQVAARTAR